MKFTVNWLKQYVDFELSAQELADRLTMLGLEVDAVEPLYQGLDQIRVAKVHKVEAHPNADRLHLCEVDVGGEVKRIVCGAPNVKEGMLVPIALPGCSVAGVTIKKSKIRGEVSEGMLCSERELGLSDRHGGLMVLPESCQSGQKLTEALALEDTMIEVDLTPNRPDCASVIGVAREVAGVVSGALKRSGPATLPELQSSASFTVRVEDTKACPRYAARLIKNVTIAESPWWLKRLLLAVGLRPINNVVDITNFVMLEYGQPLHAFDFNRLVDKKIVVRLARAHEKMVTLDGVERDLDDQMLLICDGSKPVAIAGVMGGENSEVTSETTDILLESAYFNSVSVRRTSRTLKLTTDASYRFERGIDPKGTVVALERAAQLIVELAGAELEQGGVDVLSDIPENETIELRVAKVNQLLGITLSCDEIAAHLNGIEIQTVIKDENTLYVSPPSFRVDIEREIDLIEEIARLTGYNQIPSTLPAVPMSFSEQEEIRQLRNKVTSILISVGLSEAVNYSFIAPKHYDMLQLAEDDPRRNSIPIMNPLNEEQSVMRSMLLPGLLENMRHNLNRQNSDVALFEIGKVFHPKVDQELPNEIPHVAALFSGRRYPGASHLHYGSDRVDIFDLKGAVELLCKELRLAPLRFAVPDYKTPYLEGNDALDIFIGETHVGLMGRVEKTCLKAFGIKEDVYCFDIDLAVISECTPAPRRFTSISKYPFVNWDLAMIVPQGVGAGQIIECIMAQSFPLVTGVELFDVYSGKPVKEGCKSVALSITYHSEEKTLDDAVVGKTHNKIIELLAQTFDGQLREV